LIINTDITSAITKRSLHSANSNYPSALPLSGQGTLSSVSCTHHASLVAGECSVTWPGDRVHNFVCAFRKVRFIDLGIVLARSMINFYLYSYCYIFKLVAVFYDGVKDHYLVSSNISTTGNNLEGAFLTQVKFLSQICLEGLKESTKTLIKDIQYYSRESNSESCEYKSTSLP
jgi:hypothetical protein